MDQNVAHNNLLSVLGLEPWVGDNPGLKRKGFSTEFEHDTGLGQTIQLLKTKENALIQAILSEDDTKISNAFPDGEFTAPSMAIFTKGWTNTDKSYLAWAKGDNLNLDKAALALDIYSTNKISKAILDDERNARALLVNNITALKSLELFGDKLKDESNIAATQAIAKLFFSNVKPSLNNWISAKIKIRKLILHGQEHSAHRDLLKSNIWDPAIFPKEAIDELRKRGTQSDIRNILNLSSTGGLSKAPFNKGNFQKSNQGSHWGNQSRQDSWPFRNYSNYKAPQKKPFQTKPKKETRGFQKPEERSNNHQNKTYNSSQNKPYDSNQNKHHEQQSQQKSRFQRKNKKFNR